MAKKHWRVGYTLASGLLLLAACKESASTTLPAPVPASPEATNSAIVQALRQRDGVAGEIIDVAHEQRDGHAVSCGAYRAAPPATDRMGFLFGWVDGRLVAQEGPEARLATACLVAHGYMPAR